MRILFISSGNSKDGISPITHNQGESLKAQGVSIDYFTIKGKGIIGYLSNIIPLRKKLKEDKYHVVHAHYSLSAFAASLSGAKPLVVSLMGSDVKSERYFKLIIRIFNTFSWSKVIVKSEDMKSSIGIDNSEIIPNGVDILKFKPLHQLECKKQLGWNLSKQQILFAANPERQEKNFSLAKDAVCLLNVNSHELKVLRNIPNEEMPLYYNAADVVLLTSKWEGSPNVIKEAMACNRPIVATDVGDVKWLFGDNCGYYLVSDNKISVANGLRESLFEELQLNGVGRIKKLGLDSLAISKRIISIYKLVSGNT